MVRRKWQRIFVVLLTLSIIGTNAQLVSAAEENSTIVEQNNEEQNVNVTDNEPVQENEAQTDNLENEQNNISEEQSENIAGAGDVDSDEKDDQTEKNATVEQKDTNQLKISNDEERESVKEESTESEPENGDRANSWRFKDGEPILSKLRASQYSTWPTNIPGTVGYGIDVSEHQGVIDWSKAKAAGVDYAIVRCGYGQDQADQDDDYWYTNANACVQYGIPFGTYLYSYADTVAKARSEAQHVLRLVRGYNLSYPIYYDLEESTVRNKLNTTEIANIAQAFCDVIEDAGYEVAIYANTDWFTNYLTNSKFNQWDKWVAQYNTVCTYKGDYSMWQCSSQGRVNGVTGYVDVNIDLGAALEQPIRLVTENGRTYCYQGDTKLFGEQKVDGHWYYFDEEKNGEMAQGWYTLSEKTERTKTVYYDENGWMVYGEKKIDGHWYYFNPVTGARVSGWRVISVKTGGAKTVYYDTNGWMIYGEKEIDGYKYYFDTVTGARKEGWRKITEGQEFYYDENGRMVYGEKKIGGHWYYFDKNTGNKLTGWQVISVKTGGTKTVYYDENGWMVYGEKKIDRHWYYFNPVTGARVSGWCTILVKTGGTKTVYYDTNGQMVYGEKEIRGEWYYFDEITGKMAKNVTIDGYYYDKDGKRISR